MNNQIEIKYGQLRGLIVILDRIKKECRLPVVKALHLKRFIRTIDSESELYNAQYQELLEKYVKKDENGKRIIQSSPTGDQVQLTDGNAFSKELKELFEQTFEVDSREVDLTIDDLGTIQMTVEEVDSLEGILTEEEEQIEDAHPKVRAFPKTIVLPTEVID